MSTTRIRNKYLSLVRLVFAGVLFGCATVGAETPFDELKSKLDQALVENSRKMASDQKKATIDKMYLERLAALRTEFLDQGSLDGVLEVQDEIKRFENAGGVPAEFSPIGQLARYQRIYANEIKKIESEEMVGALQIYNAYRDALLKREEELVRMGFIDKAVEVRKERERVKKLIRKLSRGKADPGSIRPEDVFSRPAEPETALPAGEEQEPFREKGNLPNEAFDALKARFNQLLAAHWETVASDEQKMYKQYMKELRVREFHYQNKGSLDGVLALRTEMKRLKDTGAISISDTELNHLEIVQKNFTQDLKKLKSADRERLLTIYRQYLDDTGELERALVKKRLISEATAVRKERERVDQVLAKLAQKDLVLSLFEARQKQEVNSLK